MSRRTEPLKIADDADVDREISRWFEGVDLKALAASLHSQHPHFESLSTGAVMLYIACRAVELQMVAQPGTA